MFLLDYFDAISYKPNITAFGKTRYSSHFGRIISSMTVLTILSVSIYLTVELIKRKEMIVIYNQSSIKTSNIKFNKSPVMIYLADAFLNPVSGNYQELRVNYWNYTTVRPEDKYMSFKYEEIPLENCNINKHFGEFDKLFLNVDLQDRKCFPLGRFDYSLEGKYGAKWDHFSFVNIAVNMCNNMTAGNKCPNQIEIESVLKNTYLVINYIDYEVDHEDFNNPVKAYLRSETFPINWDLHLRYFLKFKNVYHTTDKGFVFEDLNLLSYYSFAGIDATAEIRHGSALYPFTTIGTVSIIKSQYSDLYSRSYDKFQTLIAKIGGMIQAIILISRFLCYFITNNMFIIDVVNSLQIVHKLNYLPSAEIQYNNFTNVKEMRSTSTSKEKKDFINFIRPFNNYRNHLKYKKMNTKVLDIICPHFLRKNVKTKNIKFIKDLAESILSYENLFKLYIEFQKYKSIMFDEKELYIFENLPKYNLKNLIKTDSYNENKLEPFLHEKVEENNILIKRLISLHLN